MTPNRAEEMAKELVIKLDKGFYPFNMEQKERADLIAKALEEYAREANEKAEVCAKAHREQYERWEEAEKEAFEKGREQGAFECRHAAGIAVATMRERCAKVLLDERSDLMYSLNAHRLADRAEMRIRALPLVEVLGEKENNVICLICKNLMKAGCCIAAELWKRSAGRK